jgi:uncharacterized membrane protein
MPETRLVQHPLGWSMARFAAWQQAYPATFRVEAPPQPLGAPNRIDISDLRSVLLEGAEDFKAVRTDVIFLSILYPLIGLMMGNIVLGAQLFSLAFPLAAGFALLGPLFGAGLYEMSRQREAGFEVNWASAFDAFRSPAIGSIALLGVVLVALFMAWLGTAQAIYHATLAPMFAPGEPSSIGAFVTAVLTTRAGLAMTVMGCTAGFVFAVVVLAISVVSFPLLLDRNVGVAKAVGMSLRVVRANPVTMAAWGAIVAGALVLGSLPFLIGLAIVLPILGHATWHLYRRLVPR